MIVVLVVLVVVVVLARPEMTIIGKEIGVQHQICIIQMTHHLQDSHMEAQIKDVVTAML